MSYSYSLYTVNSVEAPLEIKRSDAFSLRELQSFVGGRIEIIPQSIPGVRGYKKVFVVCEDGFYKYDPNPHFPQFRGSVLLADRKLVK